MIKSQPGDYYYKAYFSKFSITHFFHKNKYDKIISLIPKKSTVLDAGCGSGILSYLLEKRKGCKINGVDISKSCIEFASKICKGKFYQRNLLDFNLNKKYDIILCVDVIEHFLKRDRIIIIKNLKKHLEKNGKIIFVMPSQAYILLIEPLWKALRKIIYPKIKFDDEDIHELIKPEEFIDLLKETGIKTFRKSYFNFYLNYYIICGF